MLHFLKYLTKVLTIIFACVLLGSLGGTFYLYHRYVRHAELPNLEIFEPNEVFKVFPFSARIFARDIEGNRFKRVQIGDSYLDERRYLIPREQVAQLRLLTGALLTTEDRYFYEHPGVNPVAIVQSLIDHYIFGEPLRGASTITQQIIKNVLRRLGLITMRERSLKHKVQEMMLAFLLEQHLAKKLGSKKMAKDYLLWLYLNIIPMGRVNGGFAAAAHDYFGVEPENLPNLTIAQAVILAALPKGPEKYLPAFTIAADTERARAARTDLALRRTHILTGMLRQKIISRKEYAHVQKAPLIWTPPATYPNDCNEFLTETERALEKLPEFRLGLHALNIQTTCVISWQRQARQALKDQTVFMDLHNGNLPAPQGAAVFMEAGGEQRGAITVLVGGTEPFVRGYFNRATQGRNQAGSTFKVPVYYLLLREGFAPTTNISTARTCLPAFHLGLPPWCPKNAYPVRLGSVSAEYALAHSINTATARFVGLINSRHHRRSFVVQEMINLLTAADIPRDALDMQPSLPLGPSSVTPLELTQFFSAMTHGGRYTKPYLVEDCYDERTHHKVDMGKIMRREERQIGEAAITDLLTRMLISVSQPGGTGASIGKILAPHQIALKTGTSQQNTNSWVVGCSQEMCGTVRIGFDQGSLGLGSDPETGKEWQGGRSAGPPWAKIARTILHERGTQHFFPPPPSFVLTQAVKPLVSISAASVTVRKVAATSSTAPLFR